MIKSEKCFQVNVICANEKANINFRNWLLDLKYPFSSEFDKTNSYFYIRFVEADALSDILSYLNQSKEIYVIDILRTLKKAS